MRTSSPMDDNRENCAAFWGRKMGALICKFQLIAYLPITRKLLTDIMLQAIYEHLDHSHELSVEQKGCSKTTRGTKGQLLIDKTVLHNCKRIQLQATLFHLNKIDYKKTYHMVPHSWILEFETCWLGNHPFYLRGEQHGVLEENAAGEKTFCDVNIIRGIFQGDSLTLFHCNISNSEPFKTA